MQLKVITSYSDFLGLKQGWINLFNKMGAKDLFLDFDWVRIWLDCQGGNKQIRFYVVLDKNQIVGIAPLMLRQYEKAGFTYHDLFFVTAYDNPYSEKGVDGGLDVLWDPEYDHLKNALAHHILKETTDWCYLRLHPLPLNSTTVTAFKQAAVELELKPDVKRVIENACLNIQSDWESYFADRAPRFRKSVRRSQRDIEKAHQVEFKEFRKPAEMKAAFEIILEVEKKSWKATSGYAIDNKELNNFYPQVMEHYSGTNQTMIWVLFADAVPIAYDLHLVCNGYVRTLKGSYNVDYQQFSPGKLLTAASSKVFFERGYKQIDLMSGTIEYKQKWAKDLEAYVGIYLRRNGLYPGLIDTLYTSKVISLPFRLLNKIRKVFKRS